jgi:hypothetical protein
MEAKFKSLSIFEFQEKFPDEEACLSYLSELKFAGGFVCLKCRHTHYCQGNRKYDRQCTRCHHGESPTSGILFHKVKFPLQKAFYIVYYLSTCKKMIESTDLSRKLNLRQKTCWSFKQKVMRGMKSSGNHLLTDQVQVDEFVVGGQEEGVRGRKNNKKQLIVIAIEKKGRGVSRMYGKVISASTSKELGNFMRETISKESAVKTDQWVSYKPLKKDFPHITHVSSGKKGSNFHELHRVIMGFRGWMRGMHHHVRHLQAYLDEYFYCFNRSHMKGEIFDNLMMRMLNLPHIIEFM